jgi:hypothetical protein
MRNTILSLAVLAVAAAAACSSDAPTTSSPALTRSSHAHGAARDDRPLDANTLQRLARLRAATARYHDLDKANAAGFNMEVTGCLDDPSGGMGFHWADLTRFDATVEETNPEILVFAPKPGGGTRLVAVEYAVPLTASPTPPTAFGREFHVNTTFGLWVLHAWVWEPNPAGMFADWNPRVSC